MMSVEEQEASKRAGKPTFYISKDFVTVDEKNVKLIKEIGQGAGGAIVYQAYWNNNLVSYKCFRSGISTTTQGDYEEFEKETSLLCSLRHPSVLQFYGVTLNPPRVGFLTEYCANGSLTEYVLIAKSKKEEIDFNDKIRILREIALGMSYLHSKHVIHRDLKPDNILFATDWTIRIIDFGISKLVNDTSEARFTSHIGTSFYIAPEITLGKSRYDYKVDVFSFGMIMAVLLNENVELFERISGVEFKIATNPDYRPLVEKRFINDDNEWFIDLMKRCWKNNPKERPGFDEILEILLHYFVDIPLKSSSQKYDEVSDLKKQIKKMRDENKNIRNENKSFRDEKEEEIERLKQIINEIKGKKNEDEDDETFVPKSPSVPKRKGKSFIPKVPTVPKRKGKFEYTSGIIPDYCSSEDLSSSSSRPPKRRSRKGGPKRKMRSPKRKMGRKKKKTPTHRRRMSEQLPPKRVIKMD